ncbi:hypothetical protein BKA59DRAFT_447630 [Fusarium tricinctum]|uniref:Uncharacterized protein n=1 Tax=Fusarium tricinctum TaxID=61284 RepID=A0A8K0RHH4_9HYPO|nr:hypothetical protein BKA59DRAFT_447630 [Fusarium tricinctum]
MEDDSQLFDPTQWDYDDLDFRTPQLSGINSHGVSLADPSPSPSYQRPRLPLLQLDDWDPDDTYDESPPTCVHYSIEWKLQLRKGRLSKLTNDIEQDRVLAPGAFWDTTLKDKVDKLLRQKTPLAKKYVPEETIIVVFVTDRGERDLTKRFDEFNIDWQMVEEQLCKWSPLFRAGKKLRIDISFICKEEPQGSRLRTYRDVPPYILNMIYEKERLDGERRVKRKAPSSESDRPIKIVNVLPSPYGHSTAEGNTPPLSNFGIVSPPPVVDLADLSIPKPIDRAVDDYTEWLCDQVEDERWKAGFRSAGSITKADCLDLRHVYQDRDIGYYIDQGVKAGIARLFVQDVKMWADSL